MDSITKLLGRYIKLRPPNESVRNATKKALMDVCGIGISLENIIYRGGTVYVSITSAQKSIVFTNKEKLLEVLRKQDGTRVNDIR